MRTIWLLVLFMLSGCANPFVQFYKDGTGGVDLAKSSSVVLPGGEPKLVQGADVASDTQRMLEDGYSRVGYSLFNAATVDKDDALTQAKAVHAEIVIVYTNKAAARTECLANYWIKMKPPVFGVHVQDLTTELRINNGTKKGVYVLAVVKDSPASRAGIVRGDIVRKIGDIEVNEAATLRDTVGKLAGQKVTVEVWRAHQELQKEVQLEQSK